MKFRNHVTLLVGAAALIPFLAWTLLQASDVERSIIDEDLAQAKAAREAVLLIDERLRTLGQVAGYASLALRDISDEAQTDRILRDLLGQFPLLENLHVDRIDRESARVLAFEPVRPGGPRAGDDHGTRWHVKAAREGRVASIAFSPVLLSTSDPPLPIVTFALAIDENRLLSGAVSVSSLMADVAELLSARSLEVSVLTKEGQLIWPTIPQPQLKSWPRVPKSGEVIGLGRERRYVQTAVLPRSTPDWTVVVTKLETARVSMRTTLQTRTALLGFIVLILTVGAGWAAARPLLRALKQLEDDLDDSRFGTDAATITGGPSELRRVQNVYRDVRRRLNAKHRELETVLARRSRELDAEERLFHAVFDGYADPCLLLDENWTPRLQNTAARTRISPDQSAHVIGRIRAVNEMSGAPILVEAANGTTFSCRVFPFAYRRSELTRGFVLMMEDVTEREHLERMKRDLFSIVAHELRTPVTACRLQADRIAQKLPGDDAVGAIAEDLEHLNRIINDWLAVARIDGGTFSVAPELIPLYPTIRRAARLVRARSSFDLRVDVADEAEIVWADPGGLTEVLINLFTNACRYAKPGLKPQIRVEARREGPDLILDVSDQGIGIAEENLERVFDRFFQVAKGNKRTPGGTGLGLVICRAVCEAHGGSIQAYSGNGITTFRMRLPQPENPSS